MANLLSKLNIYTAQEYKDTAYGLMTEIQSRYLGESTNLLQEAKFTLMEEKLAIEQKEQKLFQILHIDNIDQLKQRILDLNTEIFTFSGSDLNRYFLAQMDIDQAKENILGNQKLEKLKEAILKESQTELTSQAFNDFLNTEVGIIKNQRLQSKGIELRSTTGKFIFSREYHNGISWEALTPRVKEVVNDWWKREVAKNKNQNPTITTQQSDLIISWNQNFQAENGDIINTQKKLNKIKNNDNLRSQINKKCTDFIIQRTPSGAAHLVERIIHKMLSIDDFMFFTGASAQNLSGVLGEIQAMYYITRLIMGDDATDIPDNLYYSATQLTHGKKQHRDLYIKALENFAGTYGIQVKNSRSDIMKADNKEIHFKSSLLNSFFVNLLNFPYFGYGNFGEFKLLIEHYYQLIAFNVPYVRDEKNVENPYTRVGEGQTQTDVGQKVYQPARTNLLNFQSTIDRLLTIFGQSFMYLDSKDNFGDFDKNVLFIIGGTAVITASMIIDQYIKQLDKEIQNFSVRITQGTNGGEYTIVDALNNYRKTKDLESKDSMSELVFKSINLTANFDFVFKEQFG